MPSPPKARRRERDRYSDPSSASMTPLRENYPRVSPGSRAHSLSPRKRDSKQPLHIRMNLTETQMNKITDAFTNRVSPDRSQRPSNEHRPLSSFYEDVSLGTQGTDGQWNSSRFEEAINPPGSASTTFSDLMPRPNLRPAFNLSPNLAERRRQVTPAPIQVERKAKTRNKSPQRPHFETVPCPVSPLSTLDMNEPAGRAAGTYVHRNEQAAAIHRPEPLRIRGPMGNGKGKLQEQPQEKKNSDSDNSTDAREAYHAWARMEIGPEQAANRSCPAGPSHRPRRSKSTAEGLIHDKDPDMRLPPSPAKLPAHKDMESPTFSPFPFYFRANDLPIEKRGEKTMIGEKGWLERTDDAADKAKKAGNKKMGILDGIKRMAKDMTDLHHQGRRSTNRVETAPGTQLAISLNAREQSLLYCELEFHLSNSLNTFITAQLEKGRLETDKLKRIGDAWLQQGRPRVVGFRYDLETQLELVSLHANEFVFHGRRQGNPSEISGLLYAMKINARAMRIRTFCQPDSVIARQLVDAQSLFNLIGVGRMEDVALAEIGQFFRVCVEREQRPREQD